ncbi:hypothetical protein B0H21DRAFT_460679 [Amylocystis lapponica]|nr:hypothetical protein B0H21DRAFT_460679 [Amylocystis lapponica]
MNLSTLGKRRSRAANMSKVAFLWSTPARRNETTQLPTVPNEVYLEILEHIQPFPSDMTEQEFKKTLSDLVLVCHLFHATCMHRLFRSLSSHGQGDLVMLISKRRNNWCKRLLDGTANASETEAAAYVKACNITKRYSVVEKPADIYIQMDRYISVFPYLESFTVFGMLLSTELFAAMVKLDHLNTVVFDQCTFPHLSITEYNLDIYSRLKSLTVTKCVDVELCLPILRRLAGTTLEKFRTDNHACFRDVCGSGSGRTTIKDLCLNFILYASADLREHWTILQRMTRLSRLKTKSRGPLDDTISETSLKSLRSLCCPANVDLLEQLLAGSPVEHVALPLRSSNPWYQGWETHGLQVLHALKASSVPITKLEIPYQIFVSSRLDKYVPHLEVLQLYFAADLAELEKIDVLCHTWQGIPSTVRSLSLFVFGPSPWDNEPYDSRTFIPELSFNLF